MSSPNAYNSETNRAKRIDPGCRNNGTCPHCRGNRLHQATVAEAKALAEMHPDPEAQAAEMAEIPDSDLQEGVCSLHGCDLIEKRIGGRYMQIWCPECEPDHEAAEAEHRKDQKEDQ